VWHFQWNLSYLECELRISLDSPSQVCIDTRVRFYLHLGVYRGIWVARFGRFRGWSIFGGICHILNSPSRVCIGTRVRLSLNLSLCRGIRVARFPRIPRHFCRALLQKRLMILRSLRMRDSVDFGGVAIQWNLSYLWGRYLSLDVPSRVCTDTHVWVYDAAMVSRIDKITGLFCRILSVL